MSALGAILTRGASIWQSIAGNITTTRKFLRQTGTGSVSALPAWDTLVNGDLPTSAVTPGSYTNANITVNQQGIVTAAANGSSGGGGTVTTTGSPASGNLTKFTGATSISNADLTGDVTTSGTVATTLANTAVTPGSYTNTNLTVDSKGRITAAANGTAGSGTVTTTGSPASGNLTKFSGSTSITNGDLSGDVTTSGTLATTLASSGVSAATYGDATHVGQFTVNAKGLITSASNVAITGGGTPGYVQLAQVVTSGSQTTVHFASISGSYSNLKVIYTSRDTASGTSNSAMRLEINSDTTAADYSTTYRSGSSNSVAFASSSGAANTKGLWVGIQPNDGNTTNQFGIGEITLVNYAGSTLKMIQLQGACLDASANGTVYIGMGLFISSSAITDLVFGTDGTAFKNGSVFTLYGVL